MFSLRSIRFPFCSKRTFVAPIFSLICLIGVLTVLTANAGAVPHEQNSMAKRSGSSTSSTSVSIPTKQMEVSTVQYLFAQIRLIHPLVLALGQIFVVIGICLLLTDNRELELYFRIEFEPPKTDILK